MTETHTNEAKRTPGPWRLRENAEAIEVLGGPSGDEFVACLWSEPRGNEVYEGAMRRLAMANGRLITAAPIMAAICRELRQGVDLVDVVAIGELAGLARIAAAIAKATKFDDRSQAEGPSDGAMDGQALAAAATENKRGQG